MPSFNCDGCGDVVKKPKLDAHSIRCHASMTCLDCSTTFQNPASWKAHTSCISEAQKYEKSLYKAPKAKKGKYQPPSKTEPTSENLATVLSTPDSDPVILPAEASSHPENVKQAPSQPPNPSTVSKDMKRAEKKLKKKTKKSSSTVSAVGLVSTWAGTTQVENGVPKELTVVKGESSKDQTALLSPTGKIDEADTAKTEGNEACPESQGKRKDKKKRKHADRESQSAKEEPAAPEPNDASKANKTKKKKQKQLRAGSLDSHTIPAPLSTVITIDQVAKASQGLIKAAAGAPLSIKDLVESVTSFIQGQQTEPHQIVLRADIERMILNGAVKFVSNNSPEVHSPLGLVWASKDPN